MPGKVLTNRAGNDVPGNSAARLLEAESLTASGQTPRNERDQPEPSYFDISILKSSVWKWEIAVYFFLGGVSTGAYLLARAAGRFGGGRYDDIARAGAYLSLAAILPCPPLLIHDLGDPKRFHHMLRVWKPSSPMNLGTWAISAYSFAATGGVIRQYLIDHDHTLGLDDKSKLVKLAKSGKLLLVNDAAGVPMALLVAGYTGVLLSGSANPLWCKNTWLGPLFSASAIATGAEAISLALDLTQLTNESAAQTALTNIDSIAHLAEETCMTGYLSSLGDRGKPLKTGGMKSWHAVGQVGIIGAEVLKRIPLRGRAAKIRRMLASVLGLVGGFSMRWAIVHGAREAALDPKLARLASNGDST